MTEEKREEHHESHHERKVDYTEMIRKNPWMLATIVLGILVLILLILTLKSAGISGDSVGKKVVAYFNAQGAGIEYVSAKDLGNVYEITVKYQGNDVPVYATKDGKYYAMSIGELTQDSSEANKETPKEVPKTDKPVVKAFIFSYCPYGLQFEKALFPVYDLLKNKADISIVAIGAMHGEFEKTETLRQISIEQIYGKDKLFAYLKEFDSNVDIGACSGDATCLNKYLPALYTKLGVDKTQIENYMAGNALNIYTAQGTEASSLGISGSPTFIINGVQSSVSRSPDAIKTAICSAFNTPPTECSQTLSTTSPSAGFGSSSSSSASAASCG